MNWTRVISMNYRTIDFDKKWGVNQDIEKEKRKWPSRDFLENSTFRPLFFAGTFTE